ncbi:hypothetical protein F511_35900 [Dorcoceras hygrometricum]|uniref:Uncharacterized protein n=1 Tax=Dorcoceras hygrometricum TaxID=472368 RepID=A0A2Z7DE83_9LAMI|nr:hypothetical protein F511_35900 [Dorcoceras hygrometricum]
MDYSIVFEKERFDQQKSFRHKQRIDSTRSFSKWKESLVEIKIVHMPGIKETTKPVRSRSLSVQPLGTGDHSPPSLSPGPHMWAEKTVDADSLTWEEFKKIFYDKYFTPDVQARLKRDVRLGLKKTGIDQLNLYSVHLGYLKILQMGNTDPNNTKQENKYEVKPHKSAGGNHRSMIFRVHDPITARWSSDTTNQSVTTPMIALDFSGTTNQSASHNVALKQVIKSICQSGSRCMHNHIIKFHNINYSNVHAQAAKSAQFVPSTADSTSKDSYKGTVQKLKQLSFFLLSKIPADTSYELKSVTWPHI